MRDGVPPRRRAPIGAQVLAAPAPQLHLEPVPDGLPLQGPAGGRALPGQGLEDLLPGHAEEEGLVGGGEVASVAAPEADEVGPALDGLDGPAGAGGGAVAALAGGLAVVVGDEVLVEVAPELDGPGLREEIHRSSRALNFPALSLLSWVSLFNDHERAVGVDYAVEFRTGV